MFSSNGHYKYTLDDSHLPKAWYNINADLPVPPEPVLHPGTLQPVTPDFLSVLFPMNLIMQEVVEEQPKDPVPGQENFKATFLPK